MNDSTNDKIMRHSKDLPMVSVMIPFYNEESHLAEAIESVIAQTYTHWEIVLADDGSLDRSTAIARSYADKFPNKIRYFEHTGHVNKGLGATRNLAISKGKGDLFALLDADDVWLYGKLEQQINILKKHPEVGMVCEASEYWYSWNNPEAKDQTTFVGGCNEEDKILYPPEAALLLYPLGKTSAPCPSSLLIRRSVFDYYGTFEESFSGIYQLYEDQAFLCKVYLHATVYISAACNNRYRQRKNSLMSTINAQGKYHEVRQFYLLWFRQYLRTSGYCNKSINNRLFIALLPYRWPLFYRIFVKIPCAVYRLIRLILPGT